MALYASGGVLQRKPTGSFPAICVEVIDAGYFAPHKNAERQEPQQKVKVRFYYEGELEQLDEDGNVVLDGNDEPVMESGFYYADLFCTLSLGAQSILGPFIEGWRGRAFTPEERRKWDVQQLERQPAMITVVEGKNEGYYDVTQAVKVPKQLRDSVPAYPEDYELDRESDEPMASRHTLQDALKAMGRTVAAPAAKKAAPAPTAKPRPTPAPVPAATRKTASEEQDDAKPRARRAAEPLPAALEDDDDDDLPF